MRNFKKYFETVNYLEGLASLPLQKDYAKDFSDPSIYLRRTQYFLDLIGNPERSFKYIHVTGTAGKGTVATMTQEILTAAGKRTGLFTSPYVTTSIEKIRVDRKYISPDDFVAIVNYLKPFIDKMHMSPLGRSSYFEIFLAIALIYFQKKQCKWVVLEVGLGGRYDATNIIKNPIVTAITNIGYDHQNILGKTLEKIANDKAGIIKKGGIFWTAEQRPKLRDKFKKICAEVGATFNALPINNANSARNADLATAICRSIGIPEKLIKRGIKQVRLPARFEIVKENPTIVIDGAHNPSKIRNTVSQAKDLSFKKLLVVMAISEDKEKRDILKEIVPYADQIFFTKFSNLSRKSADPKELLDLSKKYLKPTAKSRIFLDPAMALDEALKLTKKEDLVLVTGSFFLAHDLRKSWYSEENVLRTRQSF